MICTDCRPVYGPGFCDEPGDLEGVELCPLHAAAQALVESILGGDIVHGDGQPGDAHLEYRGISPEGYDAWRSAAPVVAAVADQARRKAAGLEP